MPRHTLPNDPYTKKIHTTTHAAIVYNPRVIHMYHLTKTLTCCIIATLSAICGYAQDLGTDTHKHKDPVVPPPTAWTDILPLGIHQDADIDTTYLNYSRRAIPSAVSDAWATTGNFAAQGINMIWWQRPHTDAFFLSQGTRTYRPDVSTMKWYNSRIPVTFLSYNASAAAKRLRNVSNATSPATSTVAHKSAYLPITFTPKARTPTKPSKT